MDVTKTKTATVRTWWRARQALWNSILGRPLGAFSLLRLFLLLPDFLRPNDLLCQDLPQLLVLVAAVRSLQPLPSRALATQSHVSHTGCLLSASIISNIWG